MLGEVLTAPHFKSLFYNEAPHKSSDLDKLTLWYNVNNGKGTQNSTRGCRVLVRSLMDGGYFTWKTSGRIILKQLFKK
jgi:hypothetical protein